MDTFLVATQIICYGVGIVSAFEFGHDERLCALAIDGMDIEMMEYVACLADRRDLRIVRAFLDVMPPLVDEA